MLESATSVRQRKPISLGKLVNPLFVCNVDPEKNVNEADSGVFEANFDDQFWVMLKTKQNITVFVTS